MTINIILAGPRGKMGREAIKMIKENENLSLVACLDKRITKETKKEIHCLTGDDTTIFTDPEFCFTKNDADVFVDLTVPDIGYEHTKLALEHNIHTVVGTSGFTDEQLKTLSVLAKEKKTGCLIAPNFAIGAVLMMQFAKMAAAYFPDIEIIEKHHDNKIDAPSGTAKKTVDLIKETRGKKQQGHPEECETIQGARGANMDGIHVHSMRLPGLVAHQEVVFGGKSQLLTVKHDSFHRESFMDGLKLAIEKIVQYEELIYGLEHVMELD